MKPIALIPLLACSISLAVGQTSELAQEHSLLTTQCKSIRGHAGRIVAEAGQGSLNKDVAMAHLDQVAKFQEQMEKQLASSKKLLTPQQAKTVAAEYKSLEETCSTLGDLVEKLRKEFNEANTDKLKIRKLATQLRSEMTSGYDVHERMKKKLGIF